MPVKSVMPLCLRDGLQPVLEGEVRQLEIDVEHAPALRRQSPPRHAGAHRKHHVDERPRLPALARAAEDHLGALVQHARDELRRLRLRHRHELRAADDLRQTVRCVRRFPFGPRLRADMQGEELLRADFAVHGAPALGAAGKAGRVLVLPVEAATLEPVPDDVHATPVFRRIGRVHAHPGVERFVPGVDEGRHRQPAGENRRVLLLLRDRRAGIVAVELDERVAEGRDVLVLRPVLRHRIDADEQAERRAEAFLDAALPCHARLPFVAGHRDAARRRDLAGFVLARRCDGDELRGCEARIEQLGEAVCDG